MSASIHPSEIENHIHSRDRQRRVMWGSSALSLAIFLGTLTIPEKWDDFGQHWIKTFGIVTAGGTAILGRMAGATVTRENRILQDWSDVSDAARQQYLYEAMRPSQIASLEIEQEITREPFDLNSFLSLAMSSSVLIASVRGTGKTTMLQELFSRSMPGYIRGLDPKNSYSMGVLKPFMEYVSPVQSETYLEVIEDIYNELQRRNESGQPGSKFKPLWLVIDEYQSTYGLWAKPDREKASQLISAIINTGRERRVYVVLISQSPLCSDIGLTTGQRDNLNVIALGCNKQPPPEGGGGWESVERLIESQHLIPNRDSREWVKQEYIQIRNKVSGANRTIATVDGLAPAPDWSKRQYGKLPHERWYGISSIESWPDELKSSADNTVDDDGGIFSLDKVEAAIIAFLERTYPKQHTAAQIGKGGTFLTNAYKAGQRGFVSVLDQLAEQGRIQRLEADHPLGVPRYMAL